MLFRFEYAQALWGLLPALLVVLIMIHRGLKIRETFSKSRVVLLALVFVCLVIAIARPQLGKQTVQSVTTNSNVFFAIDISQSMLAEDIPPNRLSFATTFVDELVRYLEGPKVALFAFTTDGFFPLPLTTDIALVSQIMGTLTPTVSSQQGTDLSIALRTLLNGILRIRKNNESLGRDHIPNHVVLLSDGESHHEVDNSILRAFVQEGIRIHSVGLGTKAGTLVSVVVPSNRATFAPTAQTKLVKSTLVEENLRKISQATGGIYVGADLKQVSTIREKLTGTKTPQTTTSSFQATREYYPWFYFAAFCLLMVTFSRRRWEYALRDVFAPTLVTHGILSTMARTLFLWLGLLMVSEAAVSQTVLEKVRSVASTSVGLFEVDEADETRAVEYYNEAVDSIKSDPVRATQLFLDSALLTSDLKLKKSALYNLGNAYMVQGHPDQALTAYQQAFDTVSGYKKFDADANKNISENLELAQRIMDIAMQMKSDQNGDGRPNDSDGKNGQRSSTDPGGAKKDFVIEPFSSAQKQRLFDLVSSEERQAIQRIQSERQRSQITKPVEKPW